MTESNALSYFSRSLIFLLFSLFLLVSTSFFCQLKLVIKLREQSSFVLESNNACVRTYCIRLLLLLDFIAFHIFLSSVLRFFCVRHICTHHHHHHYLVSWSLLFLHAYLIIQCRHIIAELTIMIKTIQWDLMESGKRNSSFLFFFSLFILAIALLPLPSYWNHSTNIHLFLVIIVFLYSFIRILPSLLSSLSVCIFYGLCFTIILSIFFFFLVFTHTMEQFDSSSKCLL
jgi:hypothetical protein